MRAALGIALAAVLLVGAWNIAMAIGGGPAAPGMTDYHLFHIVGRLAAEGHVAEAYRAAAIARRETALLGRPYYMPWTYPPPYDLLVAALSSLGLVPGFLLFGALSATLFGVALWRLDRLRCWPIFLASSVSLMLNLRCGQNGLLMAGLVATGARFLLEDRPVPAGLTLGGLILKPHVAPLLPVWLLIRRRWTEASVAAAVGAAAMIASLATFGAPLFSAWLGAARDAGNLMAAGAYPLYRMTSIYASALSFGLPPAGALAVHVACAAAVIGIAVPVFRRQGLREQLGATLLAGFFVSPYLYDYDATVLGVALVLLAPALEARLSSRGYGLLLAGFGLAQSLGLVGSLMAKDEEVILSTMGPALLAAAIAVLRTLRRPSPRWSFAEVAP